MYVRAGTVLFLGWSWWSSEEEVRKWREIWQEEQVGDGGEFNQETLRTRTMAGAEDTKRKGWVIMEAETGGWTSWDVRNDREPRVSPVGEVGNPGHSPFLENTIHIHTSMLFFFFSFCFLCILLLFLEGVDAFIPNVLSPVGAFLSYSHSHNPTLGPCCDRDSHL